MNFIVPYHLHPLWGTLVEQLRPETLWVEKTLYVGLVPGVLALVALRTFERRFVWVGTGLFAFILALGTDLHTGNIPLQPDRPIWLPAYYLHQLPIIGLMRVWARFGVVTILFVALLAGVGAAQLTHCSKEVSRSGDHTLKHRRSLLLAPLIILLVALDLSPIYRTTDRITLAPRPIDIWLAQQPGDFIIGFEPVIDDKINYYIYSVRRPDSWEANVRIHASGAYAIRLSGFQRALTRLSRQCFRSTIARPGDTLSAAGKTYV